MESHRELNIYLSVGEMNCFGVIQSANTELEEKAWLTYRIMGTVADQ